MRDMRWNQRIWQDLVVQGKCSFVNCGRLWEELVFCDFSCFMFHLAAFCHVSCFTWLLWEQVMDKNRSTPIGGWCCDLVGTWWVLGPGGSSKMERGRQHSSHILEQQSLSTWHVLTFPDLIKLRFWISVMRSPVQQHSHRHREGWKEVYSRDFFLLCQVGTIG